MAQREDKRATAALRTALGEAIRKIRKRRETSQLALGHHIGLDSGNMSRVERGAQGLSDEKLVRLSAALDTPLWVLFAVAERAISPVEFELLETYRYSDSEGRALIDHAVKVARQHYQRPAPHTLIASGKRRNSSQN